MPGSWHSGGTILDPGPDAITDDIDATIPCPFVYAGGRRCTGHIVRIEAYKADLSWEKDAAGRWGFDFRPHSHYHLFCSEKGNHAGFRRQDSAALKFWFDHLPEPVRQLILRTTAGPG